jgi:hypothetical protein
MWWYVPLIPTGRKNKWKSTVGNLTDVRSYLKNIKSKKGWRYDSGVKTSA